MVSLLPKISPPSTAKQLRPIALASHVSKAYARLLVSCLADELKPQGEHQLAGKGRQAADFIWVAMRLTHLCREWSTDCYVLKLDLQRAFDSVSRERLAQKLCEWAGDRKPHETRSLIRLLASSDLILNLPWEQHHINSNVGVKQGATESPLIPLIFARLMDDLMCKVRLADDAMILPDLPHDSTVLMDGVLSWKSSIQGLQRFVNMLLPMLAYFGLVVQPAKCKLLCLRGSRATPLMLDGKAVYPMPENEVLSVMNLPLSIECTEHKVLEALVDKARGKFFGILHILCSNAPMMARVKVLEALVPTPQAQQLLNYFQYNGIRRMMGVKRKAGELWVEYESRSLRIARAKVFQMCKTRWGDKHLSAFWKYTGHLAREGQQQEASVAGKLAHFRTLSWWEIQQRGQRGVRHHRHFPFFMNTERRIAKTIGSSDWRVSTANRGQWKGFEQAWMQAEGVPWASGRQESLAA